MASRFWVGGTGTWDGVTTTHWAATTGAAGGQTVPGSADTVTFDGASGGGTVTVNTTVTVQSITCGAFTGTLDFSANNNDVTLSTTGMNGSGSGTRTVNLGNGTWTLNTTAAATLWNFAIITGLTFNANSSTIVVSGTNTNARTFAGGGLIYNAVSFGANTGRGSITISGANTFASMSIAGPNQILLTSATTQTITNAFTWASALDSVIELESVTRLNSATISIASGSATMSGVALRSVTFTGGATFTATNSLDLGLNSGITITAPITVQPTYAIGI